MTLRKLILTLAVPLILLASSPSLVAEPSKDAALDQEIYALLEAMGSAKIAEQVFDTLAQSFSQINPNIPKTFWAEMKKAIKADELFKLLIPVYRKNLSTEDIKAMLAFYKSPAGQRISKAMPAISQQSMSVGQAWGASVGEKIATEAKKRGYKI